MIPSVDFVYNATIKLGELPGPITFPGISDLAINSRPFHEYSECVASVKTFMEDVIRNVNANELDQFGLTTEVNPTHTGFETRSKDWETDEVARFWMFNKKFEGQQTIAAVGQAKIFMTPREEPVIKAN